MPSNADLDRAYAELCHTVEWIRQLLYRTDAGALASSRAREDAVANRSASFIWLSAGLETFVGRSLNAALLEMTSAKAPAHTLNRRVVALTVADDLEGLAGLGKRKRLRRACDIMDSLVSTDPAVFPTASAVLDGHTLRHTHFDLIWALFKLPEPSLPSPIHKTALDELADLRNNLAHGHLQPSTVGRMKSTDEVLRTVTRIQEISEHLYLALAVCVEHRAYLVAN